jgi:hypothetical protein
MKVVITYHDTTSLTVEEVVRLGHHNYGKSAKIETFADSLAPHDQIYFALQQMLTHQQLSLLYDNKFSYQKDIKELRAEVLVKLQEIMDSVIIDNESRVS